ncbi:hypothetical protein AB0O69_06815 [Streptomyces xiamenensis]|uniref:hypothetical protein n=1 Tax=Streptomyces xiamenensis TaxID=408015 RepID=UPI003446DE1C
MNVRKQRMRRVLVGLAAGGALAVAGWGVASASPADRPAPSPELEALDEAPAEPAPVDEPAAAPVDEPAPVPVDEPAPAPVDEPAEAPRDEVPAPAPEIAPLPDADGIAEAGEAAGACPPEDELVAVDEGSVPPVDEGSVPAPAPAG